MENLFNQVTFLGTLTLHSNSQVKENPQTSIFSIQLHLSPCYFRFLLIVMKRKKASASANEKLGKDKIEEFGNCSSYADLPSDIITKIMLNYALPIESILICKCVCKNWRAVISDSHFAKLHLQRAQVRYMMRTVKFDIVSRTLYLLPHISEIEGKNHFKLKRSFKLPLRNEKSILDIYELKRAVDAANKLVLEKSPYIACNPNYMKFEIVNSCNGLLCLASPSPKGGFEPPIVICNPVTGEFITLPKPRDNKGLTRNKGLGMTRVQFGFGFEPKTNEYKVIKVWGAVNVNEYNLFIEIYTLGTPTWKNVEFDPKAGKFVLTPYCNWELEFLTCMNGALHWISLIGPWISSIRSKKSILCFNFESERLQSFPSPPYENNQIHGMGEVSGLLYLCHTSGVSNVTIMWVMKKYGDGESWTKAYSIDTLNKPSVVPNPSYCLCFPVKHPKESVAAMFYHTLGIYFTYYVPEMFGLKVFPVVGTRAQRVEVIPHIPSLVLLKDIVKGDNIEVLNIHSRCAKLILEEGNEVPCFVKKIVGVP